jgi:hypothetical protein
MQQATIVIALVMLLACSAEATGRMLVSALLVELMADGTTILSLPLRLPRPDRPQMLSSVAFMIKSLSMHVLLYVHIRFANV